MSARRLWLARCAVWSGLLAAAGAGSADASEVRTCVTPDGRTVVRSLTCAPGERDRDPPPVDEVIPLLSKGARGQYWIPAMINQRMTVDFLIDTGANLVTVPSDLIDKLTIQGALRAEDWLGTAKATLADGSSAQHPVARLDSLRIGSRVLRNVTVAVTPAKATPLLGTSALEQLGAWRVDLAKRQLLIPVVRRNQEQSMGQDGSRMPPPEMRTEKVKKNTPSDSAAPPVRRQKLLEPPPAAPATAATTTSGGGKVLRQCWRPDGTSFLTAPPCPSGGEAMPAQRQE
ncbi:MAG: clan AA aspartic protease [Magnetococcales bacterium]|nr:clan AA aspartic protease [Magnetococcales bacterium]NGZ05390.1 clan AA aspartic protease [Magnetococcales bacterium]